MQLLKDFPLKDFYHRLGQASRRLLMLDYDGTLAPFQEDPSQAVPYPGVRPRLQAILASPRTRLVLVSGRAAGDLLPLLGLQPVPEIWGSHGRERRRADESYQVLEVSGEKLEGLRQARREVESRGWGDWLEEKPGCLALHFRGRDPRQVRTLRQEVEPAWKHLSRRYGLESHEFDGGVELRVPGFDKGNAVRQVLAEEAEEVPAAYLGDDLTDEDAFRALEGRGLSVLVRPELRKTEAHLWLRPPEELLEFLDHWS